MPDPFGSVLRAYYETLDHYRLLTYGQQVVRAVRELERPELAAEIHARLRHLIVDEYQDVNPAQERLIELLTGPQVELCVVGDDQQAIYQWRGSDVSNIVTLPRPLPVGGDVRDHDQPAEPAADHRGRQPASPGPSRSGSTRRWRRTGRRAAVPGRRWWSGAPRPRSRRRAGSPT